MAGDGDPSRVACALTTFAMIIFGDDLCARHALALEMLQHADELMGLRNFSMRPRRIAMGSDLYCERSVTAYAATALFPAVLSSL